MRVKCIDNTKRCKDGEGVYTIDMVVGKIYTVIYEDEDYYRLKERGGYFRKERFVKVK